MTTRDFLSLVLSTSTSEEVRVEAQKRIDEMNAKSSADKAKRDADNAPLMAMVKDILADGKTHTASDIATRTNLSTSKVTALVKKMEGIKVDDVTVNRRIVKGYHI